MGDYFESEVEPLTGSEDEDDSNGWHDDYLPDDDDD